MSEGRPRVCGFSQTVPGGGMTVSMQVRGRGVRPVSRVTTGPDGLPALTVKQGMVTFTLSPRDAVTDGHILFAETLVDTVRLFHEECVRLRDAGRSGEESPRPPGPLG
jgi:hypothetical protein